MLHQTARYTSVPLRSAILGWETFKTKARRNERYLAVALRIDNDGDVSRSLDLRAIRLHTVAAHQCRCVAALPEKAAYKPEACVIAPADCVRVTLAFMIPASVRRFVLRLPPSAKATFQPQRLSLS